MDSEDVLDFDGNQDNDFFEINDSGILHWYFEDGGYDFDYESTNDWNQDNVYELGLAHDCYLL